MASNEKEPPCVCGDELQAGPDLGDGSHVYVRHTADHDIQMGTLHPIREGQPIPEGSMHLTPIGETGRYRVEPIPTSASKGPAKVNSRAYRDNWDSIFGQKMSVGAC